MKMKRNSNLELLRIISMAMIIGLHYFNSSMGGALGQVKPSHFNFYFAYLLESMFIVGVNCFVLITGYFMIEKKSVGMNRIVEILIIMLFYSIVFYLLALSMGLIQLNVKEIFKTIMPFFYENRRWFIKTYLILYILSPFLNVAINNLDQKNYKILLIILLVLFSVWPSFFPGAPSNDYGYGIITFVILYAIGGWLRKYYNADRNKSFYLAGFFISALLTFASSLVTYSMFGVSRAWGYNYIFNMTGGICLFLFFSKLKIDSRAVNYIAQFSLGVFFIHSDFSIRALIYNVILQCKDFYYSPSLILHAFGSILVLYAISVPIDIGRAFLFEWIWDLVGNRIKILIPAIWHPITITQAGENSDV